MRHRFLMPTSPGDIAVQAMQRVQAVARLHGWDGKSSVTEWLNRQLTEGNQAKQIVQPWEENSLKGA
ncbi:hypothetical protein Axy22_035 [Achromobacter phage vB_AxyP_19-32_Axy22]|uniref:Uncharacterized protein n=1 Tax=Achromobacter phage vB_AxyP_19-32_Axy22 TaxID=2591046 RepID=A0A514CVZ8_9CAUD|nr:hypothetical protein Axy22_035 [Achromobacter phage vB_AxyP_19-32_Axy22]